MHLRFSDITQPTEFEERVGPLTLPIGYHYEARVEPVVLMMTVEPVQGGHRLDGGFDYAATLPCSRCLTDTPIVGTTHFVLDYQPAQQAPLPEEDAEVTLEETQVIYYEEGTLALEDLVAQQMYLELPEKALCKPDCKGLCPRCGADLNPGPCPCPPEADSRWTALGQIHEKE